MLVRRRQNVFVSKIVWATAAAHCRTTARKSRLRNCCLESLEGVVCNAFGTIAFSRWTQSASYKLFSIKQVCDWAWTRVPSFASGSRWRLNIFERPCNCPSKYGKSCHQSGHIASHGHGINIVWKMIVQIATFVVSHTRHNLSPDLKSDPGFKHAMALLSNDDCIVPCKPFLRLKCSYVAFRDNV
jgi:hypothetical protein